MQVGFSSTPLNGGAAEAPASTPSSCGLSAAVTDEVLVLPFNDRDGVEALLAAHGNELAVLLVEPLSKRSGMALPRDGFYDFLREITSRYGTVLVFDEVIAFRCGPTGAQGRFGASPNLTTYGKIIGGGLPIGGPGGHLGLSGSRKRARECDFGRHLFG